MANKTSAAIYTKTNEVRIEENAKVIAGEATPYRLNEYGIEADKIYISGCLDAAGNTRALWLDGRFGNENIVQSLYMTYQGKKNESDEWGDFSTLYYKDYKYLTLSSEPPLNPQRRSCPPYLRTRSLSMWSR